MREKLDKDKLDDVYLYEGDELEISYIIKPPFANLKKSLIYLTLNRDKRFRLISLSQPHEDELIIRIVAIHSPIPVALIVVAITAILVGYFVYGSIHSIEKITKSVPKITFPLLATALGGLAVLGISLSFRR